MNSKNIIKRNHRVYEKFFTRNNLVLSMPLLLNWAGDIFGNYAGIRIKQKLPFRIYIGLNKIKQKKIIFKSISYLDLNEDNFIESNLEEYAPFLPGYLKYFNNKYKKEIKKYGGVEVTILSELSRGIGLGFNSILSFLFIVALEKIYNNYNYINQEDIKINDLLNSKTTIDSLFRKSLELNRDLGIRINKIENQLSSFFDSYYPIVSFLEECDDDIDNINLSDIKIYGYRLNEMEKNLSSVPFIPLDYGLIYSGRPVLTDNIVNTNENTFKWTKEVKDKLKSYFGKKLEKSLPVRKPLFYKTFISEKGNIIKDIYGKLMGAISLELLNLMIKIYSTSYVESNMKNFIDVINKIRYGNHITRKSSQTFNIFLNDLFDNFDGRQAVLGLAPSDTTIMGGTVIFAIPYEGFRKDLFISIDKTKKKSPGTRLLYANWSDGIERRGFVVEQDLENKLYSKFVSRDNMILQNINGSTMLIDNDYLEENNLNGLTLDLINKKIYLDGEKLTSKDIHSQTTTIELFEILINELGKDISNKDLPKSSYSSNKNEMLGKIILPMLKLIEKRKKIKLPLICKGGLTDFYIKLKKSKLEINIIKKLS